MMTTSTDVDDPEHDLRLEIMRLDRKLKLQQLRHMDQQLTFAPVKLLLGAAIVASLLVAIGSAVCLA